jgi:beta-glucosidase
VIDYQGPKPICDWWGVNYYARGVAGPFLTPKFPKGEIMTDMQYSLYPKGLYENIVRGSQLGVPMYVTEVGCADRSDDDHIRVTHVETFTNQVCAAPSRLHVLKHTSFWCCNKDPFPYCHTACSCTLQMIVQ